MRNGVYPSNQIGGSNFKIIGEVTSDSGKYSMCTFTDSIEFSSYPNPDIDEQSEKCSLIITPLPLDDTLPYVCPDAVDIVFNPESIKYTKAEDFSEEECIEKEKMN